MYPDNFEFCEAVLNNSNNSRPSSRDWAFPRVLDLPAELRLHVASYAVSDGFPLKLWWKTYKQDTKVGSFVTLVYDLDLEATTRTQAMCFTQSEAMGLI